jgi:type II secretory pathway pseudopilin PulG
MPTYTVNRRSWFPDLGLVEPGVKVNWDGLPGTNLDAVDDEGKQAKEEAARVRRATAAAQQAAQQLATSFQQATVAGFQPAETSFAAQATVEAPEARRDKSGVLRPADQVPEGDTPGPSPSTGSDIPPDSSTFAPAGVVSQPAPAEEDEDEPAPKPRRRKPAAEPTEEE